MKNIILAATVTLVIFASTDIFARGFSVGVLGSYAIDNGEIDKSIERTVSGIPVIANQDFVNIDEPIEIGGATFFLRYDFKNNLFLRTGFESYFTINSGSFKYDDGGAKQEYSFDYKAYAIPFYAGIILSPDRGRTSIYGAAGIFYAKVDIEREIYDQNFTLNQTTDSSTDIFGIGGVLGIERLLFFSTYLVIEYTFYAGSDVKHQSSKDPVGIEYYYYQERYSLPTQQLRVGLKYDF